MTNIIPETRVISREFRISDNDNPTITGYAAVFDQPSEYIGWIETIDPHAFDNVMSTNPDVRALFNHDSDYVLGRSSAGTLKLAIDSRGLSYIIDPPDTQFAKDLIVSMKRGDIKESSFGFIVKRDQWSENKDGSVSRRILEIDQLLDVSPVTYPAFSQTTVAARNLPDSMPSEYRSRYESNADESVDVTDDAGTDGDLDESLEPTCTCQCAQCQAGTCSLCSDNSCTDEVCSCYNQRSQHISDVELMRLQLRLSKAIHR